MVDGLMVKFNWGVMDMRKCAKEIMNWHKKGSYTVEASFLMVIIIILLTAVIYLGFYLHDRAYLQNAAYETALIGSLNQKEADTLAKAEEKKTEFLNGRLMGTKNISGVVEISQQKISVRFQGEFPIPGFIIWYFSGNKLPIQTEISLNLKDPKSTVNKIHGIDKLRKGVAE